MVTSNNPELAEFYNYSDLHKEEEEGEESATHCTAACQYAHKIECVCGCGGKNHGIRSMVKMDAYFVFPEDKAEIEV